ncbi:MAG: glycosyltransferase family 4 protein, partial [Vulcanimicrobiaceae bacterium]
QWLCESVMPIVWRSVPDAVVTLAGSNPGEAVQALKSERVRVTGYVRDAGPLFRKSRLFVAPLRFGAGMKGKIGQALEYGLPVVTTPVGAEGFDLRDGENAVIAPPEPEALAAAIVSLYGDAERWQRISKSSAETLRSFTRDAVMPVIESIFSRR